MLCSAKSPDFEMECRNYGGTYYWYYQMDQPILVTGQPEFEISLLANLKVRDRIQYGADENIPFYFEGYIHKVKTAKKGDKTLVS